MIEVSGLVKNYGHTRALAEVSFVAEPGCVTGLVGPNGAGKTTVLRIMLGLDRADRGTALIRRSSYATIPAPARTVGAVMEGVPAYPGRTVAAHLRVFSLAAGLPRARAHEVMEDAGLGPHARRRIRELSQGMRQRLGIATALLGRPTVLILDEPMNGLDPEGLIWLRGITRSVADGGGTVLMSSHLLGEVQNIVDTVVVLARGRVHVAGRLATLLGEAPASLIRIVSPDAEQLRAVLEGEGATCVPSAPDTFDVRGIEASALADIVAASSFRIFELTPIRPTLEEFFLQAIGSGAGAAARAEGVRGGTGA